MDDANVPQTNRETCYFCGSEGPILTHHIIPRRFDGGDAIRNLVDLCPTCHQRLERLYDDRFYAALGVGPTDKQVSLINEAVAQTVEDLAESVELELSTTANAIREKYIRGDVSDNAFAAYKELTEEDRGTNHGSSVDQRERIKSIRGAIEAHEAAEDELGADIGRVVDDLVGQGFDKPKVMHEIEKLRQRGEVYEPIMDRLATTT